MRLGDYNAPDIEFILREESPGPAFPPSSDRAHWGAVRARLGEDEVRRLIDQAETDASAPIPALPASLYLEFTRTGRREGYQDPMFRRRQILANLAMGELLEGRGRFLDPLLDIGWAICEEGSWAMPAHQPGLADPDRPIVDLGAAMTALQVAELVALFGDQIDPALTKLVRHEVNRRCVTPYLTRHDHWWLHNTQRKSVNNWTAVCNAGVAGAAIHLEQDPARLASILARAARSMDDYLDTFDADGGSSEGPGYWSYGFGYYTLLAHLVEQRTNGRVDFLAGERLRAIAQYPVRTQLSPHRYVAFSDCDPDVNFIRSQLTFLGRRLNLPAVLELAAEQDDTGERMRELPWAVRGLSWRPDAAAGGFTPAKHDWFGEMMWMLARVDPANPSALVLAVKGGNNDEMHNQNDVGSFIVHVGGESVIAELGRGRYTKAYFGPQRYEHFVNSSLGHSVPVVNGHAQLPGPEYAARLVEHQRDADLVRMDLAGAYPRDAGLASLLRSVQLQREPGPGSVELVDEARFSTEPGSLESVLITLGEASVEDGSVHIRGERAAVRVGFDPVAVTAEVVTEPKVEFPEDTRDVRRIVFTPAAPATEVTIRLVIEPA